MYTIKAVARMPDGKLSCFKMTGYAKIIDREYIISQISRLVKGTINDIRVEDQDSIVLDWKYLQSDAEYLQLLAY